VGREEELKALYTCIFANCEVVKTEESGYKTSKCQWEGTKTEINIFGLGGKKREVGLKRGESSIWLKLPKPAQVS